MKKKKNKGKKIFTIALLLMILWIIVVYMYITYQNIEMDSSYETAKLQSTNIEQTVENVEENSQKIANMIEEVTQSVVGISKLKNAGSSIFSNSNESELGLGTGVVVSTKGYILSNSHVTGEKYSKCYITLESGSTYDGTVMWADSDLDLSITKINAKNLKAVNIRKF